MRYVYTVDWQGLDCNIDAVVSGRIGEQCHNRLYNVKEHQQPTIKLSLLTPELTPPGKRQQQVFAILILVGFANGPARTLSCAIAQYVK
jgi:hypothetical protein